MSELNNLEDLFHHQLKDIYSAETQLIDALPEMMQKATSDTLKSAFSDHLQETKGHKRRLEEIAEELGIELTGETCNAMKGLIEEAKSFISEDATDHVRDAGIIADAQRVEHYEISAYGTVVQFAKALGKDDIADKLSATLDEENGADSKLNNIAKDNINKQAKD